MSSQRLLCLMTGLILVALILAACGSSSSKLEVEVTSPKGRVLLQEVQLADRFPPDCDEKDVNCTVFKSDRRDLIIWVKLLDDSLGLRDLEEAYVVDGDGSRTDLTGNGLWEGRLFISFNVPADARDFTFHWLDNPPVDLGK